ncbi:ABC transporter substrate-binding protein [Methanospirillum hungatei]|uniref:substrate-binding periplasmic protein n=1 Tax=Methanospirillum hungatei TaxID=2203 RepID=UPI0026ED467C|nr:transporter substrate-binding domain-containing protein [Methanospirillum hungatei]MCA1916340.1 transporter substrate-binding domain-containing protein [Methanospirillum hungatei]
MKSRGGVESIVCILLMIFAMMSGCIITDTEYKTDNLTLNQSLDDSDSLVLYTEEQPPFNYINEHGQLSGRSTEIVKEIMRRLGVKYPIHMVPWAEGYRTVITTPNTAIYSIIMTHERESMFKWVGPIADLEYSFFSRSDNQLNNTSLESFKHCGKIAVVSNDAREWYLTAQGFDNILSLDSDAACIHALAEKKADFWLGTKDIYAQNVKRSIWQNMPEFQIIEGNVPLQRVYIGFNRKTPDSVIKSWQETLDGMKDDGTYDRIQNRYMPYICSWVRCTP